MNDPGRLLVVVCGPTATGKTSVAIRLAQTLKTEILSADSRQFYREMQIGTARPRADELALVPHHFIGHISISQAYDASRYENDALGVLEKLFHLNRTAILTGGSGLYINAVCHGIDNLPEPDQEVREKMKILYGKEGIAGLRSMLKILDPVYYDQVDLANPKRLLRAIEVCIITGKPYSFLRTNKTKPRNFSVLKIGLQREKEELYERINARVDQMMADGLLAEAEGLLPFRHMNALNTVGYKELFTYFDGDISLDMALQNIKTHSRNYAKRQMTWLRKDPSITWFHSDQVEEIINFIFS